MAWEGGDEGYQSIVSVSSVLRTMTLKTSKNTWIANFAFKMKEYFYRHKDDPEMFISCVNTFRGI
jgi:hypothetical protein